jgi:DNA-binding response OmpR family regulator
MKKIYYPVKKKTILIVEDDQALADIYRSELQSQGFQVEIANNGANARHALRNVMVDLVILDLSLPGMKGIEVLREIRSESGPEVLPIITLANSFLPNATKAAQEAGATRCVTKASCTSRQLLEHVLEVLTADPRSAGGASPRAVAADDTTFLEFQAKLVTTFRTYAPEVLATLRAGHYALVKTEQEDSRRRDLIDLRRQVHSLVGLAGLAGFRKFAELAGALEALFIELHAKPGKITTSVIRTIAQAVDGLGSLVDQTPNPQAEAFLPPRILVVDDEVISRETICCALGKANLNVVRLDDSLAAQRLLEREQFDLIFLDVEMPRQDGLALCVNIREMPTNRTTPVVFVTAHSDFGNRAQSALSGGNDFIAKPFLLHELAIKALTWLFKDNPQPLSMASARQSTPAGTGGYQSQPCTSHPALELRRELLTA